jgi:D-lyxose ketol-isomerase
MKRSELNRILDNSLAFFDAMHFLLPPFARFSVDDWRRNKDHLQEIIDLQLGWDVTTFGMGDFNKVGLLLFTLRNGKLNSSVYPKPYAEKIMIVQENQVTPCHFHWNKREDIINRGGGNLIIELYHADPAKNGLCGGSFPISVNGMTRTLNTGDRIVLTPGDSVALEPIHAHRFYGEPGKGTILVGEVSSVNDDTTDNCFIDKTARFDDIEEDESPKYLLANEIQKFVCGR